MTIHEGERADLSRSSNFHKTGNVAGMKERCDDLDALLVRCGDCGRNVPSEPHTGRHIDRNRRLPLIGRLPAAGVLLYHSG